MKGFNFGLSFCISKQGIFQYFNSAQFLMVSHAQLPILFPSPTYLFPSTFNNILISLHPAIQLVGVSLLSNISFKT